MQALNLQLLEPQNSKIQPKKISQGNEPKSDAVSFRSMVQSAAKKENKISSEEKAMLRTQRLPNTSRRIKSENT